MKQEEEKLTGLPENAFRELKPGEVYNPLMSPNKKYPEVNLWSVLWGIAMAILFSAAAAYLGLKVGQVFEAAIPIAIIAVGVSGAAKRKNALGENVIIQSIGASSGVIVAGARLIHSTRNLSGGNHGYFYSGIHQFIAGRRIGYSLPHPIP